MALKSGALFFRVLVGILINEIIIEELSKGPFLYVCVSLTICSSGGT